MSCVLIEDDFDTEEAEIFKEWNQRFSIKRNFDMSKIAYNDTTMAGFWEIQKKFDSGKIEASDGKNRSHGTMGWTWLMAVPIQSEFLIQQSFYETVFILDKPICVAPSLTRPYFLWFTDIDIKQTQPVEISYVRKICQIVSKVVSSFYPDLIEMKYSPPKPTPPLIIKGMNIPTQWNNEEGYWIGAGEGIGRLRYMVTSSGFKNGISKNDQIEYGMGLHMYSIGRLLVTEEQAHIILIAIRVLCERELGPRIKDEGFNSWLEVFDDGVYKGQGGTRMLGSCKVKPCSNCTGKMPVMSIREEDKLMGEFEKFYARVEDGNRTENKTQKKGLCQLCNGRKKYLDLKSYQALFILDHLGKEDESMEWLLDDPFQCLLATCLRVRVVGASKGSNWTTHWKCLPGYSLATKQEEKEMTKKIKFTASKDDGREAKNKQRYPPNALETVSALACVHKLDDMYLELLADYLIRDNQKSYRLEVKNSRNFRFCLRCKKEHTNRIYFQLCISDIKNSPKAYIYQKSHSDNIECKEGLVIRKKIPLELQELLFGQTFQNGVYVPILTKEDEWPKQRNFSSNVASGTFYPDGSRNGKEKIQYINSLFTWITKKRKDRDPTGERKHVKNKIAQNMKRSREKSNPAWQVQQDPSTNQIYTQMANTTKKQKKNDSNLIQKYDMITWGTHVQ